MIERLKDHKAEYIAQLPDGEFDVRIADPHWNLFQFKFGLDFFTISIKSLVSSIFWSLITFINLSS